MLAAHQRHEARGDILLVMPDALTVVDVSVIHPAADTNLPASALGAGHAAAKRDTEKRTRYQVDDPTGYAFIPLSTETYGRLGKPALALLKRLSSVACETRSVHQDDFIDNALRELSIGLCRGNAVMYRRGQTALARVTGEAIQRGDETPSAEVP